MRYKFSYQGKNDKSFMMLSVASLVIEQLSSINDGSSLSTNFQEFEYTWTLENSIKKFVILDSIWF